MLWRTGSLNAVNMLFFWSVVGLNVFGLMVTQTLGSVFRAVLLTTRTATVRAAGRPARRSAAAQAPARCVDGHSVQWGLSCASLNT
jgi:hypothetical protein